MPTPREKFQELLKKLFQFDCAELDFGIYRIMSHKRAVIERFIEKDLLDAVTAELSSGALAQESDLAQQLTQAAAKVRDAFGDDALDAEGNLLKGHDLTLGKEYFSLRERAGKPKSSPEVEAEIFNQLYAFFSRYYDEGDFMSLRRYSKRDKYAIPYNGEEIHFHWANSDQYYIKTAENFTDYSYKHGGWTVHFKLRNVDVEQNNVKRAKRFFLPRAADVALHEAAHALTIPFEYRPLTPQEQITLKSKPQETILAEAVPKIAEAVKRNTEALAALLHEKRKDAEGNPVSLLDHHLRVYTRKNTSDFFIHKDLDGFLKRELDFYLKNEVLNLDELEAGGEGRTDHWFQILRVIKAIGRKIIAFAAQLEDFQKRLFEKKKFVTEVHYCVTLDRVPVNLFPEIAKNEAQIAEWKRLFYVHEIKGDSANPGFSEPLKIDFLKANNKLLLDTRFFAEDFKTRLLASIKDLDANCDGLLIHSDNFQALRLIRNCYKARIKCEYIDPPYNTNASSIPYKNDYKHSSWATLMRDRLEIMAELLKDDGAIFVSIDKNERTALEHVMNSVFSPENKVEELIWTQNTNDGKSPTYSTNHEYVEVFSKRREAVENDKQMFREPKPGYEEVMALIAKLSSRYPPISQVEEALAKLYEDHKREYRESIEAEGLNYEEEKRNDPWKGLFNYSFAEYRDKDGKYVPERDARARRASLWVFRESDWTIMSSETKQSDTIRDPNHKNFRYYRPIHPITGKPCSLSQRGWKGTQFIDPEHPERKSFESLVNDHRIAFGPDEGKVPQQKRMLHEVETNVCKSVFVDYSDGEKELMALFNKAGLFLAPKHTRFVSRFVQQSTRSDSIVLDCFAGSGSTAHAVINLNRKENARRKYILVEVGDYFHTLIKPRVCKAVYSPTWREGKPITRTEGISHCFKYLRLESYEDALENVTFQLANDQATLQLEDYVLSYMLDLDTRKSDTLLNVAKLDSPFSYMLHRHGKDEPLAVDLPETFNYLLGLRVESRRVYDNKGTRYLVNRGRVEGRETVVIWRATRGWTQKDFEADRDFVAKERLAEGVEDVFVNTDSFIEGARSLDPVFKHRMFNEE